MLPKSNFEQVIMPFNHSSAEASRKSRKFSGSPLKSRELSTAEKKGKSRQIYSKEDLTSMNKKFRDIRTSQYKRNTQKKS